MLGGNVTQAVTEEPSSQTKGEIDDMETKEDKAGKEQELERPTKAVPISAFRPLIRPNPDLERMRTTSTIKLTDTVLKIPTPIEIELIGSSRPQPTKTPTLEAQPITIISISQPEMPALKVIREDPDEPIRVPYRINGKMHYLTNDEINAHMEKEEQIKKAAEEAKMFAITKTEVIKVVQE
ncbi:hypothetical protein Tco_0956571 [Tanacetum coccineum]